MKGGSDLENMNMDEFTNVETSRDLQNETNQMESDIKKVFIDTTTDLNYNSNNESSDNDSSDNDSSDNDSNYSDSEYNSESSIDDFTDLNDIKKNFEKLDLNEFQKGGTRSNEKKEFKIIDLEDNNEDISI